MKYRRLGDSGLRVSTIALGTWLTFGERLDDRSATAIVHRALDFGVNLLDTADVYELGRAEESLGVALEGVPRKDYVLATKCYFPTGPGTNDRGLSRKHIDESFHASLRRLQVEYIDLYQCHRYDEETPIEETVRTFGALIEQGKLFYWGVSTWTAAQIEEALTTARALGLPTPISNQPPYNLMDRRIEADVVPACIRGGLGIIPYSPLAQGVLTGKYLDGARPAGSRAVDERRNRFMGKYLEDEQSRRVARLRELAADAGLTPAQLALAWLLHRDGVTSVIVGATRASQVEENVKAADAELSPDLMAALDETFPAEPA